MARHQGRVWPQAVVALSLGCGHGPVASTLQAARPAAVCDAGFKAFSTTVFPLVRGHCVACHDTGGIGRPAFAVADAPTSYDSVSSRVDFGDIDQSIFVVTGGNRHCLLHGGKADCGASHDDVLAAVDAWWSQGENTCNHLGSLVTASLTVPADLPEKTVGFRALRWDLGTIDATLAGTFFEIEAQHFADPGASTRGAYRFRKPRVATGTNPVFVKGLKIAVNGLYDVRANTYATLRQTINPQAVPADATVPLPFPALSPFTLIVLQDKPAGDTLEVAFDKLNVSTAIQCKAMDKFAPILDLLAARNCYDCHAGGPAKLAGSAPANQRLNMNVSPAELCAQALQRMDRFTPDNSVYVTYPLNGNGGHPVPIPDIGEVEPAWTNWVNAEIAP